MPSCQRREHALVKLLSQCFHSSKCHTTQYKASRAASCCSRHFHSARICQQKPVSQPRTGVPVKQPGANDTPHIAVLGGGITGLASAHYLTRELPDAKVTIYEENSRLGGWVKSQRVNVGNGHVVLEQGPRSLRTSSAGLVTLDIIGNLGIESEMIVTSKDSVAAKSRFIYYPDHLVKMPGPGQDLWDMLWTVFTEPVFRGSLKGMLFEHRQPPRSSSLEDESIGDFFTRRTGNSAFSDNLFSAVLHGIYAGDIYKLSMKSLASMAWNAEGTHQSLTNFLLSRARNQVSPSAEAVKDAELGLELARKNRDSFQNRGALSADVMRNTSVYTFKNGLGALSNAMAADLQANPNVTFKQGHKLDSVDLHPADKSGEKTGIAVTTTNRKVPSVYNHAISTIPANQISAISNSHLPGLAKITYVTVMVVNLFYTEPDLLPEAGFGYLIPRSIPFAQNPECALGVVFDTYSSQGQDTVSGTKVTVMIGGHWWDGFRDNEYPDEDEGASMAKAILKRHLKIDAEPEQVLVGLQRDCIPQYHVGHQKILKEADNDLFVNFDNKLSLAGSSYKGVGLNDCVRQARDAVMEIKNRGV